MSGIPPPEEYLQADFEPSSLKVAQLRGLLLEYNVPYMASYKKADLVSLFEEHIRPQAQTILADARDVQPSNEGFINVANDGTESVASTGQKRVRGRSKKSISLAPESSTIEHEESLEDTIEVVNEPPIKRLRGRQSRAAVQATEAEEPEVPSLPTTVRKGRSRKSELSKEDVQVVVEIQQATPAKKTTRGRASLPTPSPGISFPSAPSSTRRRSVQPSSASIASDTPGPEPASERKVAKRRSEPALRVMDDLEEEEEDPKTEVKSPLRTPKRLSDSGFTDFNPFQSGSEDAAERERRRRKSSMGLSARKPSQPRISEPATPKQEHQAVTPPTLRRVGPSRENLRTPPQHVRDAAVAEKEEMEEEMSAAERYNNTIREKLNEINSKDEDHTQIAIRHKPAESHSLIKRVQEARVAPLSSPRSSVPLGALFLLLLSFIANYKSQSASLGFCDSGSNVNDIVLTRQSALDDANACIARRTALDLDQPGAGSAVHCDVSALPLVPFVPRPTSCAPCPQHAVCEDGKVIACEPEYILSENPLSIVSPLLDGVPGFGPKVFPPSCRPDTVKKRMIGGLAQSIESDLARGRGQVVCAGLGAEDGRKGQGERFGVEETALRETYAARRDPKFSPEQFNEIFEAALKDLVEHDDVIESIDVDGRSWYAAVRTDMTLTCAAKLRAVDTIDEWKSQLASTAAVLAGIAYIKTTLKHRQQEKYKAEELVHVVLKRLQDQERLHYSDAVTSPNPFIPITQLRDLVMPPKGSTTSRSRLWQRVQDLVEANANVAVREQEVHGELWKTWQWQGVGDRHVTWDE